jgi:hypothetical protein
VSASPSLVKLSTRIAPLVSMILRSPAHWLLSAGLMLITVTGRKSGRAYTIPVGYIDQEDAIVILVSAPQTKQWWRNYLAPAPIGLLVRGVESQGVAEVVPADSPEFRDRLEACLRRSAFLPYVLRVEFDARAGLTRERASELGERLAMVRVSAVSHPA